MCGIIYGVSQSVQPIGASSWRCRCRVPLALPLLVFPQSLPASTSTSCNPQNGQKVGPVLHYVFQQAGLPCRRACRDTTAPGRGSAWWTAGLAGAATRGVERGAAASVAQVDSISRAFTARSSAGMAHHRGPAAPHVHSSAVSLLARHRLGKPNLKASKTPPGPRLQPGRNKSA